MIVCLRPKCGSPIPVHVQLCPSCGFDNAPPNVRAAGAPAELNALKTRFQTAMQDAKARGCESVVAQFAIAAGQSVAVHAVGLARAEEICKAGNILITTFAGRIRGGTQTASDDSYDKKRPNVEAKLFPYYDAEIRYAALSLNGDGVPSFGPILFVFKDEAIKDRASVFEENSVHFFESRPTDLLGDVPAGFRSTWTDRGTLAGAKLGSFITAATQPSDFQSLLIRPSSAPGREEVLEVHIFGPCNQHSVARIRGPRQFKRREDHVRWQDLQSRAAAIGTPVEYSS